MSYNDIRYVNVEGRQIPVGHPSMSSYSSRASISNEADAQGEPITRYTVDFSLSLCDDKAQGMPVGAVSVQVSNIDGGHGTIVFPVCDANMYGSSYTCVATRSSMYPSGFYYTNANRKCNIKITFFEDVQFHVVADVGDTQVSNFDESISGTLSTATMKRPGLKAGVDYGTQDDMRNIEHEEGRIFYVAVD